MRHMFYEQKVYFGAADAFDPGHTFAGGHRLNGLHDVGVSQISALFCPSPHSFSSSPLSWNCNSVAPIMFQTGRFWECGPHLGCVVLGQTCIFTLTSGFLSFSIIFSFYTQYTFCWSWTTRVSPIFLKFGVVWGCLLVS